MKKEQFIEHWQKQEFLNFRPLFFDRKFLEKLRLFFDEITPPKPLNISTLNFMFQDLHLLVSRRVQNVKGTKQAS